MPDFVTANLIRSKFADSIPTADPGNSTPWKHASGAVAIGPYNPAITDISGLQATLNAKADKATTLAGYGITDAALDTAVVHLAGPETITGQKRFNSNILLNGNAQLQASTLNSVLVRNSDNTGYSDLACKSFTANGGVTAINASLSQTLSFTAATTATTGIVWGSDTNLYRNAADSLKTDDSLSVGVNIQANNFKSLDSTKFLASYSSPNLYIGGSAAGANQVTDVLFKNSGTVAIPGAATIGGTLDVSGLLNANARLRINGSGAFSGAGACRSDMRNSVAGTGVFEHIDDTGMWQLATTTGNATKITVAQGIDGAINVWNGAGAVTFKGTGTVAVTGSATIGGTLGVTGIVTLGSLSDVRLNRSAAGQLKLEVYHATLAAWQETVRYEASSSGAKLGFYGATAVLKQTVAPAATDAATTQTLANSLRNIVVNLGLAA